MFTENAKLVSNTVEIPVYSHVKQYPKAEIIIILESGPWQPT